MVKQGGTTENRSPKGRPIRSRIKCKYCNRSYAMKSQLEAHESSCKTFRKSRGLLKEEE